MSDNEAFAALFAALRSVQRKTVERCLLTIAVAGTVLVLLLYGNLFSQLASLTQPPKSTLYGVWKEKDVAPYLAQTIEIRPDVVLMDGRVVTTRYDYDGHSLRYRVGGQAYLFQMRNEEHTEMRLASSAHYNPTFQLSAPAGQLSENDKKHLQ
ncbi:DUF2850 domain-containing protein [Vibrio sp. ABG19]|uniref:DUF2850 domain-containing protein n=1 Tax=Vibrio sp. ABG19 TaxID=2817385 RepID=UPI00249E7D6A|nr:DUF2850 domain-containing protein [Vibrio sp. ABG19]WGY46172.1 DUF2850 domain-containing protein [Vibrio sp. ABG19]